MTRPPETRDLPAPGEMEHESSKQRMRQILRRRVGVEPTDEDVRVSCENLVGFFAILGEWDRKGRLESQPSMTLSRGEEEVPGASN